MDYDLTPRMILDRLVGFPTVSRDSNLPLVDFVQDYLAAHGIDSHRIPTPDGQKAGVIAQVGPNVPGGVVLSAHTDVVPVDGQAWDTDPFTVVETDGRLYGRGTTDMKGFVAQALHAMVRAKHAPLQRPLQLALSRDEEIGLLGASDMAQGLLDHYPKAAAVIVGEPTELQVVSGHKSCDALDVHVRGYEVHSSRLFEGVSAIYVASQLIEWCRAQTVANQTVPPSPIAALYDPPFTTLHVGMIHGGTAHNITARDCHFTVDVRCVGDDRIDDWVARFRDFADGLQAQMHAVHADTFIKIDVEPGPGLAPEQDGAAETLVRGITGDNGIRTEAYGTDGGHFQLHGFSTVICGPGSIAQAHQPNEYLAVKDFNAGGAFLDRVIETLGH
ncbi:MAG: acetylornithine deacetylase [Pseudomonadota bacterium]